MGDNYAEKQHTRQSGHGNTVHTDDSYYKKVKEIQKKNAKQKMKANGVSISRPAPAADGIIDQRQNATVKNKFWQDVLSTEMKDIIKKRWK